MSAELFLQLATGKGLLDDKTADKVRAQLQESSRTVEPDKLATLLVKKERLTKHQAKMLLEELEATLAASQTIPSTSAADSSLGLAPIEEDDDVVPSPAASQPAASDSRDVASPSAEAIDEELGLTPLDEDDHAVRATPAGPVVELEPLEDAPPAPTRNLPPIVDELVEHGEHVHADAAVHPPLEELEDAAEPLTGGPSLKGRRRSLLTRWLPKSRATAVAPKVRRQRANQWDSPLMLVGGGALVLMVLLGLLLYFLLNRVPAEEVYQAAEEDYQRQAYGQAIDKYEKFVSRFPNHGKASLARVRRGLAHLRESVESQSWDQALARAKSTLEEIKVEEAFGDGRLELVGILPEIYQGFVFQAQNAATTTEKQAALNKADDALSLVNDPEYLPTSTRTDNLQRRLQQLASDAALVIRDINRDKELAAAIEKIQQATQGGQALQAYEVRKELLGRYPQLANNQELQQAVLAIMIAEQTQATSTESELRSASDDPDAIVPRRVIMAERRGAGTAPLEGQTAAVLAAGAAYGLDATSGAPLWRRWVGHQTTIAPRLVSTASGEAALVVDGRRGELLLLDAVSGSLQWRLALPDEVLPPVVLGNRAWVATRAGKLWLIDLNRGVGLREAVLPQSLSAGPAVDPQSGRVYLPAQHSSLYVLDAETLECLQVAYVGHGSGSVAVAPAVVGGQLFIIENGGTDFAWLHLLGRRGDDVALQAYGERVRLEGQVFGVPAVSGRRALIATDRGGLYVFEADPAASEPARLIAKTLPSSREEVNNYAIMDGNAVYVAGMGLAHYQLQPARGELVRRWIKHTENVAVGVPTRLGEFLLFLSRPRRSMANRADLLPLGAGRGASEAPQNVWSIDLGIPPAGAAALERQPPRILVVSSQGGVWRVGSAELQAELAITAIKPPTPTVDERPFERSVTLDSGAVVCPAARGQPRWLLFDPANASSPLNVVTANIPETTISAGPVAVGDRLALATNEGPLYVLDATTGEPALMPFQPRLQPGQMISWLEPSVIAVEPVQLMAADEAGNVYRLAEQPRPRPHLAVVSTVTREGRLSARTAVGEDVVFVVSHGEIDDTIVLLSLADLEERGQQPLSGMLAWGPQRVGDQILVATNSQQLYAFALGGELTWEVPLEFGPLAGPPLAVGDALVLTFVQGQAALIDRNSGARRGNIDTGQPLGAAATLFDRRLLLLGRDSTLLITDVPKADAASDAAGVPP